MSILEFSQYFDDSFGCFPDTRDEYVEAVLERTCGYENLSCGVSLGRSEGKAVYLLNEDRFRHVAIIGRTGSGKSNQILQMEREDIRDGAGVAVFASHVEDALYPLRCVPLWRLNDVVLIDPTNTKMLPCMNPLDVDPKDEIAVSKAISDCIQLLKCQSQADWAGPRFDHMARLGLETMFDPGFLKLMAEAPRLGLLERMFSDPDYVRSFLPLLKDERLKRQWRTEAGSRRSSDGDDKVQWFLSKVTPFMSDRTLQNIFRPAKRTIDFKQIVNEGKILVAVIPEARIGHDAAYILRTWLTMQLKDAILSRGATVQEGYFGICEEPKEEEEPLDPFFVYIDEFAQFATPDFAGLLTEARKYRVGFTIGFQHLEQTRIIDAKTGRETDKLIDAILSNVGTMICYSLSAKDMPQVGIRMNVPPYALMDIERYHPFAAVLRDNEVEQMTLDVPLMPKPDWADMPARIAEEQIIHNIWLPVIK